MEKFNVLPLVDKCSVLHEYGRFVDSFKNDKGDYAIYVLNGKFDFLYAVMFTNKKQLGVIEITVLENSDIASFIDVGINDIYARK
jgi:hypothetical protein